MGTILSFQDQALDRLRQRLGAAEEANQDLIAFARGHHGAVQSIHRAVLTAIGAPTIESLIDTVVNEWPAILGIDSASLVLLVKDRTLLAAREGPCGVEPALVRKALGSFGSVAMRSVERGHPLFGKSSPHIRAEALIRLEAGDSLDGGILLLGQRESLGIEGRHGGELLQFLGRSLAAMIDRWLTIPTH